VDVTADCQEIVKCVKQICGKIGSHWTNNFTLLHMVDIFKGSDNKKIKESGKMLVFKLIIYQIDFICIYVHCTTNWKLTFVHIILTLIH